jgi:glutamate 5-kinase
MEKEHMIVVDEKGWTDRRDTILEAARLIVIKVGSAVLTSDRGLDLRVVNRLADQIASLHDRGKDIILVSSGAVAAGRGYLQPEHRSLTLDEKQAAAAIGQSRLMHSYDEAFERYDKITAQVLLTRNDMRVRHRFLNARNTFSTLLSNRIIPIVNENDTVVIQELEFGDNDYLATLLLNLVRADLFINLTSSHGVYAENPDKNPQARRFDCILNVRELNIEAMCQGKSVKGSGGMYSKLLSARRAAQLGVPTLIVSGTIPFALEKAFSGQDIGTWVLPEERAVSQRKFWLAYNLDPVGSVTLDQGAQDALLMRGKSLLPAGIREVQGDFSSGELIRILGPDRQQIGAGLSNFSARELRLISGKKSAELEGILGRPVPVVEAVHRDNLLLDAAH